METPPNPRSTFLTLLRWFFFANIALITLVALFYAVENFRGKRAWERYRQDAEKRGVVFDFAAQVPPTVPDEQNAAAIPLIESWFDPRFRSKGDPVLWPDLFARAENQIARHKDKTKRHVTDLVAWREAFATVETEPKLAHSIRSQSRPSEEQARAATNVLAALQVYDPALEQLREGLKRPHSRYPVDYDAENPFAILIPHLAPIKRACTLLAVRASANLAAGNSEAASQDMLLALRLIESLDNDTFLISYLVRVACLQIATQPIWEGMVQHRWTDAQLKAMQERAGGIDFLRGLQRALDTERAAGVTTIDWVKQMRSAQRFEALGEPESQPNLGWRELNIPVALMPRGWWDLEKLSYARLFESQTEPIKAALETRTLASAPHSLGIDGALHRGFAALWHHEMMAGLLLPALDKVQRKAGMAQAVTDEIVVACALERARLAAGSYPQSLETLTPKFLAQPRRDIMTGQPFIYRSAGDGYLLYSVGWDRTDEGGTPDKVLFNDERGDWVWQVPGTAQFE